MNLVDNCVVPPIPRDLGDMAYDALAYAREFMEEYSAYTNDYILPTCYFNTCVVTFSSAASGSLHQVFTKLQCAI